jgi:inner membrane protein
MPTSLTHAVAGAAIAGLFPPKAIPTRWLILGAACSVLPDLDILGFRFGIHYDDFLGHRGFSHSLAFAALLASTLVLSLKSGPEVRSRGLLWLYLFLATASHGVFDALTNGGLGVAFFAPFDNTRYFSPIRLIRVVPLELNYFSLARLFKIAATEFTFVWLPLGILAVAASRWYRRRESTRPKFAA